MYLDKLNESKALVASKDDSVNNKSQSYANIHMSLMNMDPFIWFDAIFKNSPNSIDIHEFYLK